MTQKLTLNYGVRLDVINPQTVNEPRNGGWLDLATGAIRVAGLGAIGLNGNVENSLNWAPRIGIAYQVTDKTVKPTFVDSFASFRASVREGRCDSSRCSPMRSRRRISLRWSNIASASIRS